MKPARGCSGKKTSGTTSLSLEFLSCSRTNWRCATSLDTAGCLLSLAQLSTGRARAVLGLLSFVLTQTAPSACLSRAGARAHTAHPAVAPHKQLVALLFVWRSNTTWKSLQDPLHQFTGFSMLPEVRKAATRARRALSQYTLLYPRDSSTPKSS